MDYYNTLDDVAQICINNFQMLVKFGNEDNLKQLQNGSVYMKNLKYYNELEANEKSGKPDLFDGKWALDSVNFRMSDPITQEPIATGTAKTSVISFGYEKNPIFCLFSYDARNCGAYKIDKSSRLITIETDFTKGQRNKIRTALGEYALVILDTRTFINKILTAAQSQNLECLCKKVLYDEGNSVDKAYYIMSDKSNIAFSKRKSFEYQQEYRFLIKNYEVEDHLCLNIGDISMISKIMSTKELLNLRIELTQKYEIKNNAVHCDLSE